MLGRLARVAGNWRGARFCFLLVLGQGSHGPFFSGFSFGAGRAVWRGNAARGARRGGGAVDAAPAAGQTHAPTQANDGSSIQRAVVINENDTTRGIAAENA